MSSRVLAYSRFLINIYSDKAFGHSTEKWTDGQGEKMKSEVVTSDTGR